MILIDFSYYFSVEGQEQEGGLYSVTFEFAPELLSLSVDRDLVKENLKKAFIQVKEFLEAFLKAHSRELEVVPVFSDNPAIMEAGYKYESARNTNNEMKAVYRLKAELQYKFTRTAPSAAITMRLQSEHRVNCAFLDAILACSWASVSTESQKKIDILRTTLANWQANKCDPLAALE